MRACRIEELQRVRVFFSLTSDELVIIRKKITLREYGRNETILLEGETSAYVHIVLSGLVKASLTDEMGKEMIFGLYGPGDIFKANVIDNNQKAFATMTTIGKTLVGKILKKEFLPLLRSENVLADYIAMVTGQLHRSWYLISLLQFNDACRRMEHLLVLLARDYGEKMEDEYAVRHKIIHQDLASLTGLARETVTKVLNRMKKEGVYSVSRGGFRIRLSPRLIS